MWRQVPDGRADRFILDSCIGKNLMDKAKVPLDENLIAGLGIFMESALTVERVSAADDLTPKQYGCRRTKQEYIVQQAPQASLSSRQKCGAIGKSASQDAGPLIR